MGGVRGAGAPLKFCASNCDLQAPGNVHTCTYMYMYVHMHARDGTPYEKISSYTTGVDACYKVVRVQKYIFLVSRGGGGGFIYMASTHSCSSYMYMYLHLHLLRFCSASTCVRGFGIH